MTLSLTAAVEPTLASRTARRNWRSSGRHTSGAAPGFAQGNVVILPSAQANDFLRFCVRNPVACPLIGVGDPGSPFLPSLGDEIDLRTDLPRYRVWRDGELVEEPFSIEHLWRQDLVGFVIGCSFTFEEALMADGIALRHVARQTNVAMYRTSIETVPAGIFHGPTVVSMRPMTPARAIRAVQISSRFPMMHGAPVHLGDPGLIGINDISKPDYGDPVEVMADELPVFWACGVTPQAAIAAAHVPFAITHAPGCMLITDRRNSEFATT